MNIARRSGRRGSNKRAPCVFLLSCFCYARPYPLLPTSGTRAASETGKVIRRRAGGRPAESSLEVGRKVKKKMQCHPIVLLAGLLTVVRAQGQFARLPSSLLLLILLLFVSSTWRNYVLLCVLPLNASVNDDVPSTAVFSSCTYEGSRLSLTGRSARKGRCFVCVLFHLPFLSFSGNRARERDALSP